MTDIKKIKAFAFDVDGVLTDGSVLALADGDLLRTFNSKDSFAIRTAISNGYPVAIITGGCSESIVNRFTTLCIPAEDIYQLSKNKLPDFLHFCKNHNLQPDEVAFAGDDIPDIAVLKAAGIALCPSDAVQEVKDVCNYISPYGGGKGCIRNFIEKVLKLQGKWIFNPEEPWDFSFPENIAKHAKNTGRNVR